MNFNQENASITVVFSTAGEQVGCGIDRMDRGLPVSWLLQEF
jgi:hypothetical protein